MIKTSAARVVQFWHPGGECPLKGGSTGVSQNVKWNCSGQHYRKYVKHEGAYIDDGMVCTGELFFWTEWEAESIATKLVHRSGSDGAKYWHAVINPLKSNRTCISSCGVCCCDGLGGMMNTDPCVFGTSFKYSNCRQHGKNMLRQLSPGSLVAFVSWLNGKCYLDTVLVIETRLDYKTDNLSTLQSSKEYSVLTLDRLPKGCELTFYRGGNVSQGTKHVQEPFSFVPADLKGHGRRCVLDLQKLNRKFPRSVVFKKYKARAKYHPYPASKTDVSAVWQVLADEVCSQGFVLGVSFPWPK